MTITLRSAEGCRSHPHPTSLDPHPEPRWLVLAPHDDDAVLGCGVLISAARRAGIPVAIAVISDGRLGFSRPEEAADIVPRRREEMQACAAALGVESAFFLDFPDGELTAAMHAGLADDGTLTGMLPSLCALYRAFRPSLILAPTPTDLHPDHQAVSHAADIVGFHASAGIWLHLGQPLSAPPQRIDYAVYCPFAGDPDVRIAGDERDLAAKRTGIEAFASQPAIIASLVAELDRTGPVECFRHRPWPSYQARAYDALFGV